MPKYITHKKRLLQQCVMSRSTRSSKCFSWSEILMMCFLRSTPNTFLSLWLCHYRFCYECRSRPKFLQIEMFWFSVCCRRHWEEAVWALGSDTIILRNRRCWLGGNLQMHEPPPHKQAGGCVSDSHTCVMGLQCHTLLFSYSPT